MKIEKRGFVLLEVFIAIAILSLALIPILSYPYRMYKKEMALYTKIEMERVKELSLANLQARLDEVVDFDHYTLLQDKIDLENVTIYLTPKDPIRVEPSFALALEAGEKSGLLTATLTLTPLQKGLKKESQEYKFFLEKPLDKKA